MYDRAGRFIAKYHKYNLFNTEFPLFNIDKDEQNVFVDTDFGKKIAVAWSLSKRQFC